MFFPQLKSCFIATDILANQINAWKPNQNGRHFADDALKIQTWWIPIKILFKVVPMSCVNLFLYMLLWLFVPRSLQPILKLLHFWQINLWEKTITQDEWGEWLLIWMTTKITMNISLQMRLSMYDSVDINCYNSFGDNSNAILSNSTAMWIQIKKGRCWHCGKCAV